MSNNWWIYKYTETTRTHTFHNARTINSTPYFEDFSFYFFFHVKSVRFFQIPFSICVDWKKKWFFFSSTWKTRIERKERKRTLMATRCWLTIPRPIFRCVYVWEQKNDGERAIAASVTYLFTHTITHKTHSMHVCMYCDMRRSLSFHLCMCLARTRRQRTMWWMRREDVCEDKQCQLTANAFNEDDR